MPLSIYDPLYGSTTPGAPNTLGSVPDTTNEPSGITKLLGDRNFLALLAGIGQGLDPKGAGGALGGATRGYVAAQAAQERAAQQAAAQNAQTRMVIDALRQHGGLTPKDTPGVTSLQATPEGVKMEITPLGGDLQGTGLETYGAGTAPGAQTQGVPPASGAPGAAPARTGYASNIQSLLPFYSALLG